MATTTSLAQAPSTDPTGWLNKATAAFEAQDRDGAAHALGRLIEAAPPIGPTWSAVGRMAATLGEIDSAIAAGRLFAATALADPLPRLQLAERLAQYGRHDEAIRIGETLQKSRPTDPAAWHFTGVCRTEIGQREAALVDLRKALALSDAPMSLAWSWQTLAGAKRFTADDPDIAAMRSLLARIGSAPEQAEARSVLLYALGKALDDAGDVEAAFAAYAEGADLARRVRPVDLSSGDALVEATVQQFDDALISRLEGQGIDSERPIFVLGMPRSGTTLVEQILVSHPDVAAGAETGLFQAAAMPIGGIAPAMIERFAASRPHGLRALGAAYLAMLDQRFGASGRVVDKTLNHTRFIGLIHAVLPKARFVWLRRDPGAVAWSCFRTRFNRGLGWTWSLHDIARYMKAEDALHAHWSARLPEAILTVPYDDLVRDPETWIPRIADHTGLEPTEAMLAPHLTARVVPSASHSQVTQPIHTGSIEAWRRYERHLKPFFDAYGRD